MNYKNTKLNFSRTSTTATSPPTNSRFSWTKSFFHSAQQRLPAFAGLRPGPGLPGLPRVLLVPRAQEPPQPELLVALARGDPRQPGPARLPRPGPRRARRDLRPAAALRREQLLPGQQEPARGAQSEQFGADAAFALHQPDDQGLRSNGHPLLHEGPALQVQQLPRHAADPQSQYGVEVCRRRAEALAGGAQSHSGVCAQPQERANPVFLQHPLLAGRGHYFRRALLQVLPGLLRFGQLLSGHREELPGVVPVAEGDRPQRQLAAVPGAM